jgi:toxin FitB
MSLLLLEATVTYVAQRLRGRVLAVDTAVAQHCARLHVPDSRAERDALIAATAMVHGLTVVTRNLADFEPTGVALMKPWATGA